MAGGRVGEMENKTISASNLKLKLKLTEAELGKKLLDECDSKMLISLTLKKFSSQNLNSKLTRH